MIQPVATAQHKTAASHRPVPGESGARSKIMFARADQIVGQPHLIRRNPLDTDSRISIHNGLRRVTRRYKLGHGHVAYDALTWKIKNRRDSGVVQIRTEILPAQAQVYGQVR